MATSALAPGDVAIDHELAQVSDRFRFLLDVTPVDVGPERRRFLAGETTEPTFTYRPLEDDPDVLMAMVDAIDVAAVEDPTLGHLLRAKLRELELQIEMLRVRCSDQFLPLSIELYGAVAPPLLDHARTLIERIPGPGDRPAAGTGLGERIDAATFAALAEAELDHYRAVDPDIGVHVELRPDATGILVSGSALLVSTTATVAAERTHALLQHEVGTHLVTHVNGAFQPLRLMEAGLAGYEETQEGLAVLAELLVGGLSPSRVRQLAARVVAVHEVVAGASFADVHHTLTEAGLTPDGAFTTAMRATRAGGLTKDAIYLRGLLDLLRHLSDGGDLEVLLLGKVSLAELPLVGDLYDRGVLDGPRLRPRYLDDPATAARLEQAAALTDLTQLFEETP
jgi:uncharacterized protein (TIGR02421 family)